MLANIKQSINFVFQNATLIDYLAYGWVVLAFICMLFVGVFCAVKWWWQIGFLVIFVSFIGFFIGIYFVNLELNQMLRKTEISDLKTKQLEFSNTLLVDFDLENLSGKELKICKINLNFHANSKNRAKNYINLLKPFKTETIFTKEALKLTEKRRLNLVINNFAFLDYNLTTKTECF